MVASVAVSRPATTGAVRAEMKAHAKSAGSSQKLQEGDTEAAPADPGSAPVNQTEADAANDGDTNELPPEDPQGMMPDEDVNEGKAGFW
jgi:hypothetical protein